MYRFNCKQFLWLLGSLLILSGCATHSTKNGLSKTALADARAQQATLQNLAKLYQTGRQHQLAGNSSEAIAAFEKILAIDPDFVEAHNGLGVEHAQAGNYELALQHLNKAVQLAPFATHLHNNLGYTYMLQGKLIDAESALQQSLHLDPENEQARTNLMTVRQRQRVTGE
jgi:Flp pilus assembly protein TadD